VRGFAVDFYGDEICVAQNELPQLDFNGVQRKVAQQHPRDFFGERFEQASRLGGGQRFDRKTNPMVIHGVFDPVFQRGEITARLQVQRRREPLRSGAFVFRHADARGKFELIYENEIAHRSGVTDCLAFN
jgi:hypothetical protein